MLRRKAVESLDPTVRLLYSYGVIDAVERACRAFMRPHMVYSPEDAAQDVRLTLLRHKVDPAGLSPRKLRFLAIDALRAASGVYPGKSNRPRRPPPDARQTLTEEIAQALAGRDDPARDSAEAEAEAIARVRACLVGRPGRNLHAARNADIVMRHFLGGETMLELSRAYGISESAVSQIMTASRRRIRSRLYRE